jgi:hypothetical protein
MEVLPLKLTDPLWTSLNAQMDEILKRGAFPAWQGAAHSWLERLEVAHNLWQGPRSNREVSGHEPWAKWYLRRALKERDWREVKRLSRVTGDAVGYFVASRHLSESGVAVPRAPCVRLLLSSQNEKRNESECRDERVLALHAWQSAKSEDERLNAEERFLRLHTFYLMDQDIGRLNYLNDLRWDVDRDWPLSPQPLDYILTLKEMDTFQKKISALLAGKDLTF